MKAMYSAVSLLLVLICFSVIVQGLATEAVNAQSTSATVTTTVAITPTASISNLQTPSNATAEHNVTVTFSVSYSGMSTGDSVVVVLQNGVALVNGSSVPSRDVEMIGDAYSSPDACTQLPANEMALLGNNTVACLIVPASSSGSENLTFTVQFRSADTYSVAVFAAAIYPGEPMSGLSGVSTERFSVIVSTGAVSTPEFSVTNPVLLILTLILAVILFSCRKYPSK